jgi:DICT domain-containing protein
VGRALSRIDAAFEIELSIQVFDAATLEGLSAIVAEERADAMTDEEVEALLAQLQAEQEVRG